MAKQSPPAKKTPRKPKAVWREAGFSVAPKQPGSKSIATGAREQALTNNMVRQVLLVPWIHPDSSREEIDKLQSALLAAMVEMAPKDIAEGMLISQMIATHHTLMDCLRRANLPEQTFEGRDMNMKHAERLMPLYAKQMEALNKYRSRGEQNITVKHVHVHSGGQAIVGTVGTGSADRGLDGVETPQGLPYAPGADVPEVDRPMVRVGASKAVRRNFDDGA